MVSVGPFTDTTAVNAILLWRLLIFDIFVVLELFLMQQVFLVEATELCGVFVVLEFYCPHLLHLCFIFYMDKLFFFVLELLS